MKADGERLNEAIARPRPLATAGLVLPYVLAMVLLGGGEAWAQVGLKQTTSGDPYLRLLVKSRAVIEPIDGRELLGGSDRAIPFDGKLAALPMMDSDIARPLPGIWQLKVPQAKSKAAVQVGYELIGIDGRRNVLTLPGEPSSGIRVTLEPIGPTTLGRSSKDALLEGGVVLHLDINSVRHAGEYRGTLTVSINGL